MTHNNERERLIRWAKELADPNWCLSVPREAKEVISRLVEALEPRQVTTVEELDALPGGTIIRDAKGIGWQMFNKISDKPAWLPATRQEGFYFSSNLVEADRTPATVLYSPVVAG